MPSVVFGTLGKNHVCRVPKIVPMAKVGTLGKLGVSGSVRLAQITECIFRLRHVAVIYLLILVAHKIYQRWNGGNYVGLADLERSAQPTLVLFMG